MPAQWKKFALWLVIAGVSAIGALILGLWGYVVSTATPIHPNAETVPSAKLFTPTTAWTERAARAAALVRKQTTELNLPAVSVAVGAGGEVVWAEAFGYANLEKREPIRPGTRLRALGTSMALTSAAVGQLVEKRALQLDEDVRAYVPSFPKKAWPVTVRQLMAHTGGVRNDGGDEAPLMSRCDATLDGLKLSDFAQGDLLFEPGTKFHFSAFGWVLVSAAVETATHVPFVDYMRRQVLGPAGMDDTEPDSMEAIPERATFYFPRFAEENRYGPELARDGDYSCWFGSAAYLSTPADMVRFGLAFDAGKLVRPDTVKMLETPERLASGEDTGVALGWTIEDVPLNGETVRVAAETDKRSVGGSTTLVTFPGRGLVVAVMTNTSYVDVKAIAMQIAAIFAGAN